MKRLSICIAATAAAVGAVGVFGRTADRPARSAAPPVSADANERSFDGAHSLCSAHNQVPVETGNVNLIANDGYTFQGSNRGCSTPQNEPSIAVNPLDPRNLVAGANDFRLCCDGDGQNGSTGWAYYSKDGGATWTDVLLPGLTRETGGIGLFKRFDTAEDPALAFGPDGIAYYANIVFASRSAASGIAVSMSRDGGETWGPPKLLQYTNDRARFNDKDWVATGDHGQVVVTWTTFHADNFVGNSVVRGAISADRGATWTKVTLSDDQHLHSWGAVPLWANDGALYTVFETSRSPDDTRNAISVSLYRSQRPLVERDIGRAFDAANCFALNGYLRQTLSGEDFRISSLPSASIDPKTQTVAVAWADGERGCKPGAFSGATDAQVKLVFVHGTHASKPRIVTGGGDKALPSVAYRDGKVVIGFYTRGFAPANCVYAAKPVCIDYAYVTSTDGFAAEHRLSDGSSNPFEQFDGAFIGDYSSVAVGSDGIGHAVWTDSRGGDQNIYGQAFTP
jgi:hypothetical protein